MQTDQFRRTVLVVEDEWLVRDDIATTLRGAGWHVLEAGTAEGAMEVLAQSSRVDILFTDIKLGGPISGWDVAEAGRASKPEMAVLYTSGNSSDRSRSVTGSRFVDKPYNVADVLRACQAFGR